MPRSTKQSRRNEATAKQFAEDHEHDRIIVEMWLAAGKDLSELEQDGNLNFTMQYLLELIVKKQRHELEVLALS